MGKNTKNIYKLSFPQQLAKAWKSIQDPVIFIFKSLEHHSEDSCTDAKN